MRKEKLNFLKECEAIILAELDNYVNYFATEVNSKISVLSDKLSSLDFFLINKKKCRSVHIIISEGINTEYEQFYGIRFYIQKLDEDGNKTSEFSLRDYCKAKKISVGLVWFFIGNTNFFIEIKKYLDGVIKVLEDKELSTVLSGDDWIDITPDFFPYR